MRALIKKISLWCLAVLFSFVIGVFLTVFVKVYFEYSELNKRAVPETAYNEYLYPGVTWQDETGSCGKPKKSLFGDGYVLIDNPLCRYSFNLSEISTISYDDLAKHRMFYDGKIIRLQGRFYMNPRVSSPHDSRFFMFSDDSGKEMPVEFNSPWDFDLTTKLRNFIEANSPETNSTEVSIIVKFLDVSNNPEVLAISNNNPLHILLLHVEKMKPVVAKQNKKRDS